MRLMMQRKCKPDNPAIRSDDLSVISRLINQVAWHRRSRVKQLQSEIQQLESITNRTAQQEQELKNKRERFSVNT